MINAASPLEIRCDTKGRLLYARSASYHEMWVPLVERAYAKLHGPYKEIAFF